MDLYELLLFLHIAAAVIWVGSGFLLNVQAYRANKIDDVDGLKRVANDSSQLAEKLFIPASLTVFIMGVLLVIESDAWGFGQLWIVLGLIGYFATFATGLFVLKPRSEALTAELERDGMTPSVVTKIREILVLARIDLVTLFLVIAVMAVKPTGDDVGVLVGMAVVLVGASALIISQLRASRDAGEASTAAA